MQHKFSLATLLLMVAIAAVGFASLRSAFHNALPGHEPWMVLLGFFAGGPVGFALAIWNRSDWLPGIVSTLAGFGLGAAAGAQTGLIVSWPVIFAAPFVLVGAAAIIAFNRRRTLRRAQPAAVSGPITERTS
jgi:hypothetical protein